MKTMTCKQLGGACDHEFRANSFEEIAEISKKHGIEMFQKKDPAHLKALEEM
jgi:predicted small metal-binding protein